MNGTREPVVARDALLAAGAALALYLAAGVAGFGFVNYDDPTVVRENPVQSFATLGGAFTGRMAHAWLPLYSLSLGLDNALFGPDRPGPYHFHSILGHALNAALVVLLAVRLGIERRAALLAGLLFAVHPAVTESVAWVASRKDVLSFFFAGLAALVFLHAEEEPRRPALHALGALLLAAGLLAKGTVMVLPALLVLAVLARIEEPARRRDALLGTLPYFAVAAGLAAAHMAVSAIEGTTGADLGPGDTTVARLAAGLAAAGAYLRMLVAPLPLSVEHGIEPGRTGTAAAAVGAGLLAAAIAGIVLLWRRGSRGAAAALAGVLVALAPFNGILPRTSVLFAERYLYVAAALGCGLLAALPWRPVPWLFAAAFAGIGAFHVGVWRDSVRLWESAVGVAPDSHVARAKYGEALAERALDESDAARRRDLFARAAAEHALAADRARTPLDELRSRQDLGVALLGAGRPEEALAALDRARSLRFGPAFDLVPPGFAAGMEINRAKALEACGREKDAMAALKMLLRGDPTAAAAWLNLGVLRTRAGDLDGARVALLAATKADPDLTAARLALADVETLGGDPSAALRIAVKAAEAAPGDPDALCKAGEVAFILGQPLRAEEWFRKALARSPSHPSARRGLAGALSFRSRAALGEGNARDAVAFANRAAETDPAAPEPCFALGDALRAAGEMTGALEAYFKGGSKGEPGRGANARAGVYAAQALAARTKGDQDSARALLEKALAEKPAEIRPGGKRAPLREGLDRIPPPGEGGEARAALLDGLLGLLAGDAKAAEEALGRASSAVPLRPAALVLRSAARMGADDLDGAVADLESLSSETPADARAKLHLGHALSLRAARRRSDEKKGPAEADARRARSLLEEARTQDPDLVEASLALAEQHFVEGRSVDAIRELNGVLAKDPRRVEAHLVLANIMKAQFASTEDSTFLREAEDHFRRALDLDPDEARALAGLGEMEAMANRPREALGFALRALAVDPDLPQARVLGALLLVRVGRAHLDDGNADQALDCAKRADDLGGETSALCLLRSDAYRRKNDWQRAGVEVERARTLAPKDPDVRDALAAHYRDMGYAFLLKRRRDQAEEAFRRALAAEGPRTDLSEVRRILERGDEPGAAAPPVSAAVADALERCYAEAARVLEEGIAARGAGHPEEAEAKFRESLRSFEIPQARFGLGLVLSGRGDRDAAEAEYRHAAADDPVYADAWLNLGALLFRRGADAEAEQAYDAYLRHAPKSGAEETVARVEALVETLRARRKERKE